MLVARDLWALVVLYVVIAVPAPVVVAIERPDRCLLEGCRTQSLQLLRWTFGVSGDDTRRIEWMQMPKVGIATKGSALFRYAENVNDRI